MPNEAEDTHELVFMESGSKTILASHHNGFSCHWLGKHLADGDLLKARLQSEFIIRCGGTATFSWKAGAA